MPTDTYAFNYTEASNTSASVVQEMMKTLSTTLPFTDVKNTDWCFSEVARVYADGIMGGTSNTTFSPAGTLTRGQVVAMLYRMAGAPLLLPILPAFPMWTTARTMLMP